MTDNPSATRGLPPFLYAVVGATSGIAGGFVLVTLSHTLRAMGVSVAEISTMVGLMLLPSTLRFLFGPLVDLTLTSVRWVLICVGATVICMIMLAMTPLSQGAMPRLDVLAFLVGCAGNAKNCAMAAAMAETAPDEQRGAIAGWGNAGRLGGAGIGGGAGLWLTGHAGGTPVAGAVLACVSAMCAAPVLWMRTPRTHQAASLTNRMVDLCSILWDTLKTRKGVLVGLACVIPCGLGAARELLPAVARDWGATSDMVALFNGVLGGFATMPGCLIGGYLCDRFPRRIVYIWCCLAFAASEAVMALAPHTPGWFASMVLIDAFTLGMSWAAVAAVIFDCLGKRGAATVSTVLSSVTNVPLVAMTFFIGRVQTAHGSSAMLLTEAGVAAVSIAAYALLAWLWKPMRGVLAAPAHA